MDQAEEKQTLFYQYQSLKDELAFTPDYVSITVGGLSNDGVIRAKTSHVTFRRANTNMVRIENTPQHALVSTITRQNQVLETDEQGFPPMDEFSGITPELNQLTEAY